MLCFGCVRNGNLQLMADGIKSAKTKRIFERVGPVSIYECVLMSCVINAHFHFRRKIKSTIVENVMLRLKHRLVNIVLINQSVFVSGRLDKD